MANSIQHLDFDEWRVLASRDPEKFEVERRKALDAAIARAPEKRRQRLRGLQWQVDQVRGLSPNPLAACISLSDMMWEALAGDKGLLKTLRGQGRPTPMSRDTRGPVVVSMRKDHRKPS